MSSLSTDPDLGWPARAAQLAEQLVDGGSLHDPAWKAAVAAVARHRLVPTAYQQHPPDYLWAPLDTATPQGLDLAYSPTTLVTTLNGHGEPLSSSTKPDLIVQMLELLDVHDEHRVLAVGAGSGYTTALLCHRLGDERVTSVDIDDDLIDAARARLAQLGFYPTLAARDGIEGMPSRAPFDRIMATCSVDHVPWAWADQLAPGGAILVNLMPGAINAGGLVLLHRHTDRLEGRFTRQWGSFMGMRHHGAPQSPPPQRTPSAATPQTRVTTAPPNPWWHHTVVWMLAHYYGIPAGVRVGMELDPDTGHPAAGTLTAPDGSWASIHLDPIGEQEWQITEAGPTSLWAAVERAWLVYRNCGQPDWDRFGVTATPEHQQLWLDDPGGDRTWDLAPAP